MCTQTHFLGYAFPPPPQKKLLICITPHFSSPPRIIFGTLPNVEFNSARYFNVFSLLDTNDNFIRYSPSTNNVANGLFHRFFMDLFRTTNSYMTENSPDIRFEEFVEYFSLFCFCVTSDTKQSTEFLPICSSGNNEPTFC